MALESWEWFVRLMEKGSFTHAAEELQLPQQTLSARLAALERELKCKLVVRSTPLTLTRAGRGVPGLCAGAGAGAVADVAPGGRGDGRRVRRAESGHFQHARLRAHAPCVGTVPPAACRGVSVRLQEGTNEQLVRLAERNEADVVVAHFDETHPGVCVRPLYQEEVVLVVHSGLLEHVTGLPAEEAAARVRVEGLGMLRDCPFLLETVDDISGRVAVWNCNVPASSPVVWWSPKV